MRITVYAGSAPGNEAVYAEAAARFAREVVAAGHEIVYGGGALGLMGVVADAALAAGGKVTGVIPTSLVAAEVAHPGLSELHVVDTMHERKQLMADLADAFVALPGGVGTLEEIVEVWAWSILGHHGKPVTLLNVDGYWDRLERLTDRMSESGFLRPAESGSLRMVADSAEFLAAAEGWTPPPVRWPVPVEVAA